MAGIVNPAASSSSSQRPQYFRTGGSGFTVFYWQQQLIGFAQAVGHTSPQPVAPPVAVQPLDQQYPMQIVVPAAIGAGTLQVQMFELFNEKIWDRIMDTTDNYDRSTAPAGLPTSIYNDLSEIFLRLSALSKPISCYKLVYPPYVGVRGGFAPSSSDRSRPVYADQYFNCIITDIRDDEKIEIGTMTVLKNMTIQYTHSKRHFNFQWSQ